MDANLDIVFGCPEILGSKIINRPHAGISYIRSYLESHGFSSKRKIEPVYNYCSFCCKLLSISLQDSGKSVDQGIIESSTL